MTISLSKILIQIFCEKHIFNKHSAATTIATAPQFRRFVADGASQRPAAWKAQAPQVPKRKRCRFLFGGRHWPKWGTSDQFTRNGAKMIRDSIRINSLPMERLLHRLQKRIRFDSKIDQFREVLYPNFKSILLYGDDQQVFFGGETRPNHALFTSKKPAMKGHGNDLEKECHRLRHAASF